EMGDDCCARAAAAHELSCDGRARARQGRLKAKNGARVWAAVSVEPLALPPERAPAPSAGAERGAGLLLGALSDSTRRRETEDELERAHRDLHNAQLQRVRTEKMASLGLLMAGIAHEIRTPLGAVQSTQRTLAQALDKLCERLHEAFPEALEDSKLGRLLK